MRISKIKNLIPAPADAEIFYINTTVDEVEASEYGVPTSPGEEITLTQWKRVGNNPAALSSECYFGVQRVANGIVTNWITPTKTNTIQLLGRDFEDYSAIRAYLLDDNNHEVASRTIRVNKKGATGNTGPGGMDYDMRLSAYSITKHRDNSLTPSSINVSLYKRQGNGGVTTYTGYIKITDANDTVCYSGRTQDYTLALASSMVFPLRFRMWDTEAHSTGTPWAEAYLHTVSDGEKGETSAIFYPAGDYSSSREYTRDGVFCPVVTSNGSQFYLKKPTNVVSGTHYAPPNDTYWGLATQDMVMFLEAMFANFAKLGSFVISGDFFISQYGTLYYGSNEIAVGNSNCNSATYDNKVPYAYFDGSDPMVNTLPSSGSYKFRPALVLNARTGETFQNSAHVRGEVHATSGTFNNVSVSNANVSGNITVNKLYRTVNVKENGVLACGCIIGAGSYTLPPIVQGTYIEVVVHAPQITRVAYTVELTVYSQTDEEFVCNFGYQNALPGDNVRTLSLESGGSYKLIGYHFNSKIWYVTEI